MLLLKVQDLCAERNDRRIFGPLSFDLEAAMGMWLQGPNGSGKSTLLRMLCGLFPSRSGRIERMNGLLDPDSLSPNLIYIGHRLALKEPLTTEENLAFLVGFLSKQKMDQGRLRHALKAAQLENKRHCIVRMLSAGERQRLALSLLMCVDARLWLLDEPYTALDAQGRHWLSALISAHIDQGNSVIISSHQDGVGLENMRFQYLRLEPPEMPCA